MTIKSFFTFISGIFIGGGIAIFGTKKYFEERYQKRYEEDRTALEEYYHRTDEYYRRDDSDEDDEENEVNPTESDSRPGGRMSQDERKKFKERLNKVYGAGTVNYSGMYKDVDHRDHSSMYNTEYDANIEFAESEHPLDQGEDGENDPEDLRVCGNCKFYKEELNLCQISHSDTDAWSTCDGFENVHETTLEEEIFDEHQKNKDRPPKIISAETYSSLPGYIDQTILYFYAYDEVLCDENEEAVEEPERLIGDALTKYGFVDNDERIIFVMNYAIDTCYEIQKVDASWTDSH